MYLSLSPSLSDIRSVALPLSHPPLTLLISLSLSLSLPLSLSLSPLSFFLSLSLSLPVSLFLSLSLLLIWRRVECILWETKWTTANKSWKKGACQEYVRRLPTCTFPYEVTHCTILLFISFQISALISCFCLAT